MRTARRATDTQGVDADPRSQVEAPVRGALVGVIGRGLALVAAMALLALWPVVARLEAHVCDEIAWLALAVLLGYSAWVRAVQVVGGRPPAEERDQAWHRARDIDRDDATLGLLVAGWVPVALVLTIGLLLWPHVTDLNRRVGEAWIVLAIPPFAAAWLLATLTWLDACRDDLARAEHEADVRLRRYWANVGHSR